ncbi:hypothetical protein EYF80_027459 [Liparis tanakae]|uniref:Uncharacterized protein n=1 Tax=Liparis tanakae TaxID=230148 RepID=A0A4Z2HC48_9TELE|nr:hypothetical protein EYF80_027459 [Liparis tanakae]
MRRDSATPTVFNWSTGTMPREMDTEWEGRGRVKDGEGEKLKSMERCRYINQVVQIHWITLKLLHSHYDAGL